MEPQERFIALQSRVSQQLEALRELRPEAEEYDESTEAVLAAATELIDFEKRLPALLDAEPHRLSLVIVRFSGMVIGAVGLSLGLAAVAGWLPRWWLLGVAGLLAFAVVFVRYPVPGPLSGHLALRPGALVAAVGALLVAAGAVGVLEFWFVGAGVLLLAGGYLYTRRVSGPTSVVMPR